MTLLIATVVLVAAVALAASWFRRRQKAAKIVASLGALAPLAPGVVTVPNPVAHQIITDISNEVGKLENVPSHIETAIGVKLEQLREHV